MLEVIELQHLKQTDYAVSTWKGGTTKQIAIYPPNALYAEHNFLWRVSSATVESDESTFTNLPDYDRQIATLDTGICLSHDGIEYTALKPFEVYSFDGGVVTHAKGHCIDFNLMLRKERAFGKIRALRLDGAQRISLLEDNRIDNMRKSIICYCVKGEAKLSVNEQSMLLHAGESALSLTFPAKEFSLQGCDSVVCMLAEVWTR